MIIKGKNGSAVETFYHTGCNLIEITVKDATDGEYATAFLSPGKARGVIRMLSKLLKKLENHE